jgi:hypothetical protein
MFVHQVQRKHVSYICKRYVILYVMRLYFDDMVEHVCGMSL